MIKYFYEIGSKTWFGTGGKCLFFYEVNNLANLKNLIRFLPNRIPIFTIGLGSNILFRDGLYFGVIIKLGKQFSNIKYSNESNILTVGCATKDIDFANFCLKNSLTGFEFLCGIPGTIGGAIRMNSGCYQQSISDHLLNITCINRNGKTVRLLKENINFDYRHTNIPKDYIFVEAQFCPKKAKKSFIKNQMQSVKFKKKKTQPIAVRTGGSTFKNPKQQKAWELIDNAGFRGLLKNHIQVSKIHPNFLINYGNKSSLEIELLGEEIRKKVFEMYGIKLEWEIERVGNFEKI